MANFLEPNDVLTYVVAGKTLSINSKLIPDTLTATKDVASYVKKGGKMKPCASIGTAGVPLGITVHNTEMINVQSGTNAAEQYTRATYNGNMGGVVVHYYVWHSDIWRLLTDNERGWHAGDGSGRKKSKNGKKKIGGNLDTIAIEAIGEDAETEETTAYLVAYLCREHKLDPAYDVYPHKYWSGKNCPVYILPHWDSFLENVTRIYAEDAAETAANAVDGLNSDIPAEAEPPEKSFGYAADAWKAAYNTGIMDGTRPRDYVRREELALILQRLDLL